jgi:hypothetical protein
MKPKISLHRQPERASDARDFRQRKVPPLLLQPDHISEQEPVSVFLFRAFRDQPGPPGVGCEEFRVLCSGGSYVVLGGYRQQGRSFSSGRSFFNRT